MIIECHSDGRGFIFSRKFVVILIIRFSDGRGENSLLSVSYRTFVPCVRLREYGADRIHWVLVSEFHIKY